VFSSGVEAEREPDVISRPALCAAGFVPPSKHEASV
jgi:hypothetical protein